MLLRLEDVDSTNYIFLLKQRESDMNEKLSKLIHHDGYVVLKINVDKTKLMRFDPQSKQI